MKTAVFGFVIAALLLASAVAHALLGWPAMQQGLAPHGVQADLLGALAAGWHFGSASMAAFAAIVGLQAVRHLRGAEVGAGALHAIAAAYVGFGSLAFVLRTLNPHFLLFVVTGILVSAFAVLARSSERR